MCIIPCTRPSPPSALLQQVQVAPFQHEPQRSSREAASDYTLVDRHRYLILAIDRMEMGRRVFVREHPDDDAEESADFWHARDVLRPALPATIDRTFSKSF